MRNTPYKYLNPKDWYDPGGTTNSGLIKNNTILVRDSYGNIVRPEFADSITQVDKEELRELRDDQRMLFALMDAGVEAWEGYDEALANYRENRNEDG